MKSMPDEATPLPCQWGELDPAYLEKRDRADVVACAYGFLIFNRCLKCGHKTVKGYVCQFCEDSNPTSPPEADRRAGGKP